MREISVRMLQTCVSPDPRGQPVGLAGLHQVITLGGASACGHVDGSAVVSVCLVLGVYVCDMNLNILRKLKLLLHDNSSVFYCLSCERCHRHTHKQEQ